MSVSRKHIWTQRRVIAALGRTALAAVAQQLEGAGRGGPAATPGPVFTGRVEPLPKDLVADAVRWAGGDPGAYRKALPFWMFPQWGFPLLGRTLEGIPYPLARVLNAGCTATIHAPLPPGEPLEATAQLTAIDDDGRRAILHQRLTTGPAGTPEALVVDFQALVPLGGKDRGKGGDKGADAPKKERSRVPPSARELARWKLSSKAGLEFALLTGDFNPVHWVPLYARASGFRNVILHGFGTLARAVEGLNRGLFAGDTGRLGGVSVRFTKPLVLPARVGLYVTPDGGVFVGDAPGGPSYMAGTFTMADREQTA